MAEAIAHPGFYEEKLSAKVILNRALAESVTGAAVIVLSIIGLAGVMPVLMLSIATIALGMSFVFEGGAVFSRLSNLLSEITEGRVDIAELGGGLSAEFVAGFGGVTLGILSLVGILPMTLTAVAAIAFGAALILGAEVKARINHFAIGQQENKTVRELTREVLVATSRVEILIGMGAIALGILSILHIYSVELNLIAILAVGGMVLLGGTAVGARMISLFRS